MYAPTTTTEPAGTCPCPDSMSGTEIRPLPAWALAGGVFFIWLVGIASAATPRS